MKKRIFALTGILLALLLVLAGCGSRAANDSPGVAGYGSYNQKSESYKASETLFDTENPMPSPGEPGERDDDAALTTDRKLIQTAWMELESRDYAQALAALEQMVTDCGGYIESRSEQGGSLYSSRYNARYASITARIPADKLETAMGAAGELCNVVSRSTDVADVTESYTDTAARLKTLRLQEERLLEILSKATELSDVLELESRLSDVRYQIESYEATLRNYDSRVSYSTLHITPNAGTAPFRWICGFNAAGEEQRRECAGLAGDLSAAGAAVGSHSCGGGLVGAAAGAPGPKGRKAAEGEP